MAALSIIKNVIRHFNPLRNVTYARILDQTRKSPQAKWEDFFSLWFGEINETPFSAEAIWFDEFKGITFNAKALRTHCFMLVKAPWGFSDYASLGLCLSPR